MAELDDVPVVFREQLLRDVEQVLGLESGSVGFPLGLQHGAAYALAILSRPAPATVGLVAATADALRAVLDDRFTVEADGEVLTIRGPGGSMVGAMATVALRLPFSYEDRLKLAFENWADGLTEFMNEVLGTPWPAPGAQRRVFIDFETVLVWWGSPGRPEPVLALAPFRRREIGL